MKISNISFKGRYIESYFSRNTDKELVNEVRQSRPFLRQIAYSLPKDKDIYVSIEKDKDNKQYIKTSCIERKSNFDCKMNTLAEAYKNNFTMGLTYTEKVFDGIKDSYPKLYPQVIRGFINRLSRIDSEIVNSQYATEENIDIYNKIYP